MRILICSTDPPVEPLEGTGLVLRALLDRLGDRHEIRVVALAGHADPAAAGPAVRIVTAPPGSRAADVRLLAAWLVTGAPLRAGDVTRALAGAVREEVASFAPDVVHVTPGQLGGLHRELGATPRVMVPLDAWHVAALARADDATGLRRRLLLAEARRRRRFELREYRHYAAVVVVSDLDARALHDARRPLAIEVIPNGVAAERFARRADAPPRDPARLIFHGNMAHSPNEVAAVHLAREVLPRVRRDVPDATLALVGRAPTDRVRALADEPGVIVTGAVPDVRDELDRAGVYTCAMQTGSGIKNKVLEAMANGLPVVGTPLAFGGVTFRDGEEALLADGPDAFAAAVTGLIRDPARAAEIARRGREHVAARHTWDTVAAAYERLYERAAATSSG